MMVKRLTKRQKAAKTVRMKLSRTDKCPHCDITGTNAYGQSGYFCKIIGFNYVLTSWNKCTFEDIISCPLLGNYEGE